MPCSFPSRSSFTPDRANLYDEITSNIIAELEAGRLPWVQPWGSSGVSAPLAMPKNASTGRQYRALTCSSSGGLSSRAASPVRAG